MIQIESLLMRDLQDILQQADRPVPKPLPAHKQIQCQHHTDRNKSSQTKPQHDLS